ncbi:MAG: O-acetylhomoserine aminocarboxypropyltransferase/cysteine synthase [Synergistaceae bacterium]|jgi:O-acetylhomoserine (thiol)-lyase|nr:O-acetylhomoserine aminocarboxypropyltransferase/cysteine synthase [Synergistaceae bacterium]
MSDKKKYGLATQALHCGWKFDPATGAAALPIYATSAYQFKNSEHAVKLFNLEEGGHIYSRLSNPTVSAFEEALAALEGGVGCLATSSGQAAFTHLITALCSSGDNLVVSRQVYGGTLTLLQNIFSRFGITTKFVDGNHPCQFEQAIDENTRGIITETIGNPVMNVAPLETLSKIAERAGVPLIVDSTFATPILCRPIEWGAHIVVHSTTKYISGNGNLLGGAVVDSGNFDWSQYPEKFPTLAKPDNSYHGITFAEHFGKAALYAKLHASIIRDMGGCPSAFDGFLLHTSLATLSLRMKKHSENALEIAKYLETNPSVEWVSYPGLASHPQHDLAKQYLKDGCGGMMAFSIKGGLEAGRKFLDGLDLIGHMANLGDSRTLIIHPASTTHSQLSKDQREAAGITDGLLRLSVGIENIEDILEDIITALNKATQK